MSRGIDVLEMFKGGRHNKLYQWNVLRGKLRNHWFFPSFTNALKIGRIYAKWNYVEVERCDVLVSEWDFVLCARADLATFDDR